MSRPFIRTWLAPLLVALLIIGAQAFRKPLSAPLLDEFYYLTISRDLLLHGVFSDGMFKRGPFGRGPGPEHFGDEDVRYAKPGRFFAPAYPIFVYGLARVDRGLAASIMCHVRFAHMPDQTKCPNRFGSLVVVQVVLWALVALCVFRLGLLVGRSETVAWLAMLIALASGEPGYYARTYLSENVTVPAFALFMLFLVRAFETRRAVDALLAGAMLGLAAMTRPAYAYLLPPLLARLFAVRYFRANRSDLPGVKESAVFVAGALIAASPWIVRNLVVFGDPSMSRGYAEVIFPQRLAYNQMSWAEWGVAWLYWIPDFGDDLARKIFRRELWHKLSWHDPESYYLQGGGGRFLERLLAEAGGEQRLMSLMVSRYLVGDLFKHALVSLPLTMRGLGIGGYVSIAAAILAWPAIKLLSRRGTLMRLGIISLPPLVMAGLHGVLSVNIQRYNLPMLAIYGIVIAVVLDDLFRRILALRQA